MTEEKIETRQVPEPAEPQMGKAAALLEAARADEAEGKEESSDPAPPVAERDHEAKRRAEFEEMERRRNACVEAIQGILRTFNCTLGSRVTHLPDRTFSEVFVIPQVEE